MIHWVPTRYRSASPSIRQTTRVQRCAPRPKIKIARQVISRINNHKDNVSLETAREGKGETSHVNAWGDNIAGLQLHTEEALFYTWKPNCRVHYLKNGSAGPPLLLIHGFGVGSFHFEKNLVELGKDHRVWACDLFGQGASWPISPPEKAENLVYSLDTWTDQLAAFIRDVIGEEGGAYVAGNSLGGLLATTIAYRHPNLVRGLILLNATPFWTVYSSRWLAPLGLAAVPMPQRAADFVRNTLFGYLSDPATISTFLKQVYVDKGAIDEALAQRVSSAASHPHAADAFLSIILSPCGDKGLGEMSEAVVARGTPICLMHGKEDPWVKAWWARRLKRRVPGIEYYSISPAGHCPHDEVPDAVNALIRWWIQAKEAQQEGPIIGAGELWEVGQGAQLHLARARDEDNGDSGNDCGTSHDDDQWGRRPVTVRLADGVPLNWLEGLSF